MSLIKHKTNWWMRFVVGGREVRRSCGTSDKKLAQELHDHAKAALWREVRFGVKEGGSWSLGHACREYLLSTNRRKSARAMCAKAEFFYRSLGKDTPIESITADQIRTAVEQLGVSNDTKNNYYTLINSVLRFAWKHGKLASIPYIGRHNGSTKRVRYLSAEEVRAIAKHLPGYLYWPFMMCISTGLRMRNVTHLEWEQVDMEKRRLTIYSTKNGEILVVPLNETAMKILKAMARRGTEGRVFRNTVGNGFDNANTESFRVAVARAGILNFKWHDTRHTWASWMIQNGASQREIAELGGWKKPSMVERYAHLAPEQLNETAAKIDSVLRDQ